MVAVKQQQSAETDDAISVQIQFLDCGTACWSQASESKAICTPGKMPVPIVFSRMKERNHPAR